MVDEPSSTDLFFLKMKEAGLEEELKVPTA